MRHVTASMLALLVAVAAGGEAPADVKAGVDAWEQGDYEKAVRQWRSLAQAGDADAQFNLGQAYKLGRGVPADIGTALEWFRKAAAQGHIRAEDNYGLLLFQQNRRAEAMPWLERAAERDEPRAQYLVATALFNGDLLSRDWVRAYALMTRAGSSGLPQATAALGHLNRYIPEAQRNDGLALADVIAEKNRPGQTSATDPAPAPRTTKGPKTPDPRDAKIPPSLIPARPADAVASASPVPRPASTEGAWRVQLGAFSEHARADALWNTASARVEGLSGYRPYLVKDGAVTRLQAGPLATRADAEKLCGTIKARGFDCLVKAK